MTGTAKQLRYFLLLLLTTLCLVVLPLIGTTPRASSVDMTSMSSEAWVDCAAACAQSTAIGPAPTMLEREEDQTPDPVREVTIPHYLQYATLHTPTALRPAPAFRATPSKPPDILKLSGNFRP